MKTIAISKWIAYAPFVAATEELHSIGVDVQQVDDRVGGLLQGRYAAAPLSLYSLLRNLEKLHNDVLVGWNCVSPVGQGSDRIVARNHIRDVAALWRSRIGISDEWMELHLFESIFEQHDLPLKTDYVVLNRRDYIAAFREGKIDAVIAPEPDRTSLVSTSNDGAIFDAHLPISTAGLSAPFVIRRSFWQIGELAAVSSIISDWSKNLTRMSNAEVSEILNLQEHSDVVCDELRQTVAWPTPAESVSYLKQRSGKGMLEDALDVSAFRARRFGAKAIPESQIQRLLSRIS